MHDVSSAKAEFDASRFDTFAWLITGMLTLSLIGLNFATEIQQGRNEFASNSGAGGEGIKEQVKFEQNVSNADFLRKFGIALFMLMVVVLVVAPGHRYPLRLNGLALLVAMMLGWVFLSALWSSQRQETLRELVRLGTYVAGAVMLLKRFRPAQLISMFAISSVIMLVLTNLIDVGFGTFRPWEPGFRLGGAMHPNMIGRVATISTLGAVWKLRSTSNRLFWTSVIVCSIAVVIFSLSRSALGGLVFGLATYVAIGIRRETLPAWAAAGLVATGVLFFTIGCLSPKGRAAAADIVLMGRSEGVKSLTGRVPLWKELWKDGAERPINGYGYGAYWTARRVLKLAPRLKWFPRHSHNAYMELLMDLGFVGLGLTLAVVLLGLWSCAPFVSEAGLTEYRFFAGVIASGIANGLFEVAYIQPRLSGFFAAVSVLATLAMVHRVEATITTTTPSIRRMPPSAEFQPV